MSPNVTPEMIADASALGGSLAGSFPTTKAKSSIADEEVSIDLIFTVCTSVARKSAGIQKYEGAREPIAST